MKKFVVVLVLMIVASAGFAQDVRFYKKLNSFCEKRLVEFDLIDANRKLILDSIALSMSASKAKVLIGCETNTRRTQLMSVWLQTAMNYYGIYNIYVFSGGLSAQQVNKNVFEQLKKSGFVVEYLEDKAVISLSKTLSTYMYFSKALSDEMNPKDNYVGISVCSGNEHFQLNGFVNYNLPYENPKFYDKTPSEKYINTQLNLQISREMMYLAHKIKQLNNAK
jgi:arsenate reductase